MSRAQMQVVRVTLKGLRRGDAILAIRPAGCGQREAGVSQRSVARGRFVMRHKIDDEHVAIVWRDIETGAVRGHDSRYLGNCVAFVLRPKADQPAEEGSREQPTA